MRIIKLFEEFNDDIHDLCAKYRINNYTINKDGSLDVDSHVKIVSNRLDKLPLKFNRVSGNFYCFDNQLISLEGCPKEVGGYFNCSHNKLISLEGGPKEVRLGYDCGYNKIITLEGCPEILNHEFICSQNPVYEVWKLIDDTEHMELFLDYDIIRDGNVIILDRLNDLLDLIGKPKVTKVKGYKCI